MDQNKVGQYIALCRKEKQMTQSDLAKALNVSVQAVSKWERGNNYPDISLFPKLADILGTSVGELLKGEKSSYEIKTDETVTELIDYTKTVKKKMTKKQTILGFVLLALFSAVLSGWSQFTVDLKLNPYKLIEVSPETSQLYAGVETSFPFFIQNYGDCNSDVTKTQLVESYKRSYFEVEKKATSLLVTFGSTDTTKVSETTATLWCPLTVEFISQFSLIAESKPMVIFDYDEPVIYEETMNVKATDQGANSTTVFVRMVEVSSRANTSRMDLITQFTLVLGDYVIKGELPFNLIKDPELLNGTQKIIPQDYLDLVKANIEQLTKALLKSQALSNRLDVNKANFYKAYLELSGDYPFKEDRQIVFEDNQWRVKQIMNSKDTVVTFTTDLNGTPVSVEIDRGDQSTSIGGIATTLSTLVTNKLTNWPFPSGYLKPIFYKLTEVKEPWIIDMKETKMTIICTEYVRHYLIKWPTAE